MRKMKDSAHTQTGRTFRKDSLEEKSCIKNPPMSSDSVLTFDIDIMRIGG